MKKNLTQVFICFSLLTFGCRNKDKDNNWPEYSYNKTFENETSWFATDLVVKGDAHTGKFAAKIDSLHEFSYGFSSLAENISNNPIKGVNVMTWVKFDNSDIDGKLVVNVNDPNGKTKFWDGRLIKEKVKNPNEWIMVELNIDFPISISPQDKISIYVWNENHKAFLMDDFSFTFR